MYMYQGRIDPLRAARGHVTTICHYVNVKIQTWWRFSNVSNGCIWKRGAAIGHESALLHMNVIYNWMHT